MPHRDIAKKVGATKEQVNQLVVKLIRERRAKPRAGRLGPDPVRPGRTRRTWDEVRRQIRKQYEAGAANRAIAMDLEITMMQLQTQLSRLFREGMPRRESRL